jgi:hypothetical protein
LVLAARAVARASELARRAEPDGADGRPLNGRVGRGCDQGAARARGQKAVEERGTVVFLKPHKGSDFPLVRRWLCHRYGRSRGSVPGQVSRSRHKRLARRDALTEETGGYSTTDCITRPLAASQISTST